MAVDLGTTVLETSDLILRPFVMEDAPDMYQNWASDSQVTNFLTWFAHENVQETQRIIGMWVDTYRSKKTYQWAIVIKETGELIGSISAEKSKPNSIQKPEDVKEPDYEIGYCIGKKWWHQGYTSQALAAVLDYLLLQCGYKRVLCFHDLNNPNSGKVMQKCGMVFLKTLPYKPQLKEAFTACLYEMTPEQLRQFQTEKRAL